MFFRRDPNAIADRLRAAHKLIEAQAAEIDRREYIIQEVAQLRVSTRLQRETIARQEATIAELHAQLALPKQEQVG
jgi:hypothetical protein